MSPLRDWEGIWKKMKTRKLKTKVAFKDMIIAILQSIHTHTHNHTTMAENGCSYNDQKNTVLFLFLEIYQFLLSLTIGNNLLSFFKTSFFLLFHIQISMTRIRIPMIPIHTDFHTVQWGQKWKPSVWTQVMFILIGITTCFLSHLYTPSQSQLLIKYLVNVLHMGAPMIIFSKTRTTVFLKVFNIKMGILV